MYNNAETPTSKLESKGYVNTIDLHTSINPHDPVSEAEWTTINNEASFLLKFPVQGNISSNLKFVIPDSEGNTLKVEAIVQSDVPVLVHNLGLTFPQPIDLANPGEINPGDVIKVGNDYYIYELEDIDTDSGKKHKIQFKLITLDEVEFIFEKNKMQRENTVERESPEPTFMVGFDTIQPESDNRGNYEIIIGRSDSDIKNQGNRADLNFDATSGISANHIRIIYKKSENSFYIEDTSRNGTYLNDQKLIKGVMQKLKFGDVVTLGPINPPQGNPKQFNVSVTSSNFSFDYKLNS